MGSFAQNNIQVNIHHKLGGVDFALNLGTTNNLNDDFKVARLQYYVSGISLLHDSGTETMIEDLHVLVNATQTTEIDLGDHNIDHVEAIRFHIGVHPDFNNLDPAAYPSGHPLAPTNPSMHWGWAAGYRFVALEGKGGSSYNQTYELHGLGNNNYYMTEVALDLTAENGAIVINLDGDYTRILENISVNGGLIVHGDFGAAKQALANFRDYVFSPSSTATSTVDFSEVTNFTVYPNPATVGTAVVSIAASQDLTYAVSVTDILGRPVQHIHFVKSNQLIPVETTRPGLFLVHLIKDGQTVITQKLVVQ